MFLSGASACMIWFFCVWNGWQTINFDIVDVKRDDEGGFDIFHPEKDAEVRVIKK